MSERSSRIQSKMRRPQELHSHPLDARNICCPDHVYELCSLLQPQGRTEDIISALLSLESLLDTRYLLDTSEQSYERKKSLIVFANEYALISASLKDLEAAFGLLSVAEMIMGSFQNDPTESGLRTTTLMNLAYVSVLSRDYDQAISTLDEADRISKVSRDVLGCASVKVTKSALFMRLKSYQEAYIQAQHAVKLTEDLLPSMHEPDIRKAKLLLTAARLNMAAAGEFVSGKAAGPSVTQVRNELIRLVEQKGEPRGSVIKEYDESPIYREEAKAGAVSNIEDDLGSFLDGVQRWDRVRSIENPSFVVSPEPKAAQASKFPAPAAKPPTKPVDPDPKSKPQPKLPIPPLPLTTKAAKPAKALVLPRMPNSALPVIPTRMSMFKTTHIGTNMRPMKKPDYASALDELTSLSDETVRTVKTMDGTSFFLQCSLQRQSLLKLSAVALSDKDEAIPSESIDLEQLKSIVNMLGIAEVLPTDFPSKWISSFAEAAHFFILPFFQITTAEDTGKKKVELWSISPGILESQVTRAFNGQQRRLVLHQTSALSIRMCLTDMNADASAESMIAMDVTFNENFRSANIPLQEGKQSWVSFKPLPIAFLERLESALQDYEKELRKRAQLPLLLARTQLADNPSNSLIFYIFDNEPQRRWDITVKRLVAEPLTLTCSYPYSQVLSSFGVPMHRLDSEDRRCLAAFILDLLKVQFAQESGEEEAESAILLGQAATIASHRTFLKQGKTLIPVTLALVGVKDRVVGVRATAFSAATCLESGCFLGLNAQNYAVTQQAVEAPAKKKKKYNKLEGLAQFVEKETSLMTLLREKGGWETLLSALKLEGGSTPYLYLVNKSGKKKWFGRLEATVPSGKTT